MASASNTTTFVKADPSTFRTIVQKLTGAPDDPSFPKLPLTLPTRPSIGPKRPAAFKLHERRSQTAKKLEIKLSNSNSSSDSFNGYEQVMCLYKQRGTSFMVSPVSTLELIGRAGTEEEEEEEEEEEIAIAEKGFYLHPSPLSTTRGAEPELLPLFPLTSPKK
ncbi:hypothetical protein ACOSP7_021026 [Xanthoceras sorbifolium]